jgi:hypothetical protein
MPAFVVRWDPARAQLTTRVCSPITVADVAQYKETLSLVLSRIPPATGFVWLSDASGYEALADRASHLALRGVLPLALAAHGVRTSLLDLFETVDVSIAPAPSPLCRAVAHVHHEHEKMAALDAQLGRPNERYFADAASAEAWLALVP